MWKRTQQKAQLNSLWETELEIQDTIKRIRTERTQPRHKSVDGKISRKKILRRRRSKTEIENENANGVWREKGRASQAW